MGPESRQLIEAAFPHERFCNQSFPFGTARQLTLVPEAALAEGSGGGGGGTLSGGGVLLPPPLGRIACSD